MNIIDNTKKNIIKKYSKEIKKCALFFNGSYKEIETSFNILNSEFSAYEKNDILHHPGEKFDRFGLVVYGRVKVLLDDLEGNTTIMAEVIPGNTFGESLCLMKRENSDIYICAAEDSGVIWLSVENLFSGLSSEYVENLERRFAEMLASRTLSMNNRIQILSKLTLREKIITFLTLSMQNVLGSSIDVSLSREEMALYLGTNRSALSRELSKMRKDGLIDFSKNHFTVKF